MQHPKHAILIGKSPHFAMLEPLFIIGRLIIQHRTYVRQLTFLATFFRLFGLCLLLNFEVNKQKNDRIMIQ